MLADFLSVYSVFILGPSVYPVRRILVLTANCQWAMTFTTMFILKLCSNFFSSLTKWMSKSENVLFRRILGFNGLPAKWIDKFKLWVRIHGQELNSLHIRNVKCFLYLTVFLNNGYHFFLFDIMFLNETNLVYQSTASVVLTCLITIFYEYVREKNVITVKNVGEWGRRPSEAG